MGDSGWGSAQAYPNSSGQRLELKDGRLVLSGSPLTLKFGRRGVQVGCHFVTYDALDKIHAESQQ